MKKTMSCVRIILIMLSEFNINEIKTKRVLDYSNITLLKRLNFFTAAVIINNIILLLCSA